MKTVISSYFQRFIRILLALAVAITVLVPSTIVPASAASGERTLYIYYTHTKETGRFTFKRNGRYDRKILSELNFFLRDWRRNEPTKMDPALFDLIWEVYQESGATGPIHVVSAYRSPKTNEMLRSRSRAVAKNSRHTMGMAMDFFIPGVKVSKLRKIAMKKQIGGVGYYPTSGSPFVHLDTGNVRAWPRMTRAQLKNVFPSGKTLHLPNDGVPLSKDGYKFAKAQWVKCHAVPCNGRSSSKATIRTASTSAKSGSSNSSKPQKTLIDWLFGEEESEGAEETVIAVASNGPTRRAVSAVPMIAPVPMLRPRSNGILVANAPVPAPRPAILNATSKLIPPGTIAVADLGTNGAPRKLLSPPVDGVNNRFLSAYAPAAIPEPDAQRALQMLIEQSRDVTPSPSATALASISAKQIAPTPQEINTDNIRTASLGADTISPMDAISKLFAGTWTAVSNAGAMPAQTMPPLTDIKLQARAVELVAPDLEHVAEIFADPQLMSGSRYAVIFEPDEADFKPETELGQHVLKMGFSQDPTAGLLTNRFVSTPPLIVASR